MARLVSLSLLLLLLVTITTSSDEVVSSEADDDDAPVCDIAFDICLGSCWKSGQCMRCCRSHGFVHGRCSLKHGWGCYCCHTPDDQNEEELALSPSSLSIL